MSDLCIIKQISVIYKDTDTPYFISRAVCWPVWGFADRLCGKYHNPMRLLLLVEVSIYMRATIDPPAERNVNGVSLVGR